MTGSPCSPNVQLPHFTRSCDFDFSNVSLRDSTIQPNDDLLSSLLLSLSFLVACFFFCSYSHKSPTLRCWVRFTRLLKLLVLLEPRHFNLHSTDRTLLSVAIKRHPNSRGAVLRSSLVLLLILQTSTFSNSSLMA